MVTKADLSKQIERLERERRELRYDLKQEEARVSYRDTELAIAKEVQGEMIQQIEAQKAAIKRLEKERNLLRPLVLLYMPTDAPEFRWISQAETEGIIIK